MNDFTLHLTTKIVFGRDAESKIGEEAARYGKKVLLHYGGGSIKRSGLYDSVKDSLAKSGLEVFELAGVKPNPRLSLVREGIELCRKEGIDLILAVGGGSVIDSAKAIGIGVPAKCDVWDFYLGKACPEKMLPVGVVLTIPAAGSECSNGSVITNEDGDYKRAVDNQIMRPSFAIMNPERTYTLPPYQTACGITDMMAHIMERYFTNVDHVDLTDRLCEATLRTIINNAPIVLRDPENYDARAEIMWSGTIAHNGLLDTGRIGDWGSHNIEHEISGIYDVAHGAGLAVVFPAWMKYVYHHDVARFVQFAVRVFDVDLAFGRPEEIAEEGIRRLEQFFTSIGMPITLPQLGVDDSRLGEMADKALVGCEYQGHFVPLYRDDVYNILKIAMGK